MCCSENQILLRNLSPTQGYHNPKVFILEHGHDAVQLTLVILYSFSHLILAVILKWPCWVLTPHFLIPSLVLFLWSFVSITLFLNFLASPYHRLYGLRFRYLKILIYFKRNPQRQYLCHIKESKGPGFLQVQSGIVTGLNLENQCED